MAITDLTNTTWNVKADWTVSAGYGQFSINYTTDYMSLRGTFIGFGYVHTSDDGDTWYWKPTANKINNAYDTVSSGTAFTIVITGGTDATNTNLISWLETNATQVVEDAGYTLRVNGKVLNLLNGKKVRNLIYKGTTYEIKQPSVDTSGYTLTLIPEANDTSFYYINSNNEQIVISETTTLNNVESITLGFVYNLYKGKVGSTEGGSEYGTIADESEKTFEITGNTTMYLSKDITFVPEPGEKPGPPII